MIQGCQTLGHSGYWGTRPSHQHDTLMGVYSGARGSPLSARTRSRAEGDGRSDANQCCMKADLATIGPEATLKARRCVGPTRARWEKGDWQGQTLGKLSTSAD